MPTSFSELEKVCFGAMQHNPLACIAPQLCRLVCGAVQPTSHESMQTNADTLTDYQELPCLLNHNAIGNGDTCSKHKQKHVIVKASGNPIHNYNSY